MTGDGVYRGRVDHRHTENLSLFSGGATDFSADVIDPAGLERPARGRKLAHPGTAARQEKSSSATVLSRSFLSENHPDQAG